MEISVSSSQRNMEAGQDRRANGPRLEKAPSGDAFSRHLDETRQNGAERNAAAQEAKQRSSQIREDAQSEKLREERQREDRRAEEARAGEKREADRSRESGKKESSPEAEKSTEKEAAETAEQTGLPGQEPEAAGKPAEETGKTAENTSKPAEDNESGNLTDKAETAVTKKAVPQTKAAAETAPADADTAQTAAAKAADTGKTSQQAAQSGVIETAAKGAVPQQSASQAAQQTQTQNSQQTQASGQTAAGNAAQPQADTNFEAALSGGSEEGGSLPGKEGKTLGHLAAEKLGAKQGGKEGNAEAAKPAATADNAPRTAAPQQPASTPTIPGLAGFGLRGTDQPLNISFDGTDPGGFKLDTVNAGTSAQNSNPVMLRFGALPGQAQATQVPATAIAMQIARHVQKGVNTFEIRIDPPELGRVDVKLEMTDGRVNAHLVVEKPETLDLLQRDSRALQQALRDAGLDVNDDTLNFSLSDENGADSFAEQEGSNSRGSAGKDTAAQPEQDPLVTAQYHLSYAGDSGVDIRV